MTDESPRSPAPTGALKMLDDAEAQLTSLGEALDPAGLTILRAMISGYDGVASGPSARVVASLYSLLGDLLASGRLDRETIDVHLRAWRLVLTTELDPDASDELMAGLKQVRDLYAQARAA